MSRKIRTRLRCKIIGSDYSAQEPRMNAHICEAYTNLPNKYYIDPALLPDKITSKADIFEIPDDSFSNTDYLVRLFEKEMAKNSDDIDSAWNAVKAVINDPARNPKLCVNKMKEAYMADKDLYAMIAQSAYNNKYEDNLEFYPEGTELEIDGKKVIAGHKTHKNPDGKDRRSTGKVLNLASSYGMSGPTAGIRLGYTGDEAREKGNELLDSFFRGFPAVDKAIEESKKFLKVNGYVEDFYGRRRHLGEINLPDYEIKPLEDEIAFNPFLNCNKPAKKSYAQLFWELIKDVYIDMGYSGQLSNSVYERLAKLAIYPNLWKQPCITQEELQIMIDRGDSQAKYGRFLKAKQFEMGKLNGTKFLNPKSGLCVDSMVTQKDKYEFYIQPQFVNQGTATPCHYQVLYEDPDSEVNLKVEQLQLLSFYLSFYYWTWAGAIRVPGALKLATTAMTFYSKYLGNKLNLIQFYFLKFSNIF